MKGIKFVTLCLTSLVAFPSTLIGFSDTARADSKCSDVNIQVTNEYRDPINNARVDIKVVDFKYKDKEDGGIWRNEATNNKRIDPNQTEVWNKNLEYVGGESGVKIKVYYKYKEAGGNWSSKYSRVSNAFTCIDGTTVAITVD